MTEESGFKPEHLEGEDFTPLACASPLHLATEMMKRGTTIIGIVETDHGKEYTHVFAVDHYCEVSLQDLLTEVCNHTCEVDIAEDEFDGEDDEDIEELDEDDIDDYAEGWSELTDEKDRQLDEDEED